MQTERRVAANPQTKPTDLDKYIAEILLRLMTAKCPISVKRNMNIEANVVVSETYVY